MRKLKLILSLLMLICFSVGNVWAADPVELASGTFNGKNGTYTAGWTTTGTGVSRTDCIVIGAGENITSPAIDLTNYGSIIISIKARRFGSINGIATIAAHFGTEAIGTVDATGTSATASLTDIEYTNTALTTGSFVFTCTNATSAGSTHGAGINTIVIKGVEKSGGDPVVLTSIEIGGDLTTKSYEEGDKLDYSGLTATGIYSDDSTSDLTDKVEWSSTPALTAGVTSVTVTATKGEISGSKVISGLTVAEHVVAAGTYDIPMTNELWGTSYTGTAADATEVSGTAHDVTITLTKGGSTNMYINDTESRAYKDYSLVIAAPAGYTLTKMVFTKGSNWNCATETGTLSGQTWTGAANSVAFTFGGRTDFKAVQVTYEDESAISVLAPTIAPEVEFFAGKLAITLNCETPGATIHYTLDGIDPTAASTVYSEPFEINATTTVKAIAFKDGAGSTIVERSYTMLEQSTCAEVAAMSNNKNAALGQVTVTYASEDGKYIYLADASGVLLLYYSTGNYGLKAGDVVKGLIGKVSIYNKLVEFVPSVEAAGLEVTAGTAPAPTVFTAAPTANDMNKVIRLNGVKVAAGEFKTSSVSNLDLTIGSETLPLRNAFKYAQVFEAEKTYNVVGAVAVYNDAVQVYFISAEEATVTPTDVTLYFVNSSDWAEVYAYVWGGADELNAWPGEAATKEAEQVNGHDLYSYTFPAQYGNIIFNNNNNGAQTGDEVAVWDASKPYFNLEDNTWYASIADIPAPAAPLEDGFYLIGQKGWDISALDASLKFELNSGEEYKLTATLAEGDKIKVVKVAGNIISTWYPDGLDNEYTVDAAHAGTDKDIYFQETYKADWAEFGGYFWTGENTTPTPPTSYKLTFNGTGTSSDASANIAATVEAIFTEDCQAYVESVEDATKVYAARVIAENSSSLKFGTTSVKGNLSFTLANPSEMDSIVVNATQYGDKESEVTVNGTAFALTAGNKVPQDCKLIPEDEVSTITIAQSTSERIYLRSITLYPKAGSTEPTPAIKANGVDFGEVKIEASETAYVVDKEIEVTGKYLTEEITATASSAAITIANSPLPAAGGTLQLHIEAPVGAFSETITLTSGEVSKEIAITGTVKQKAAPLVGDFDTIYVWNGKRGEESATEAIEQGGTAAAYGGNTNIVVGTAQKTNWTMKLNKGFANEFFVGITLDQALAKGDKLQVAAFRTSETSAILGIDFSESEEAASTACQILHDDDLQVITTNVAPEDEIFDIPEAAAGAKFIRIYRNSGSTGIYVANFSIYREKSTPVEHTYTVAGVAALVGEEWKPAATANDMTKQADGTYQLVKENVTLNKATEYEYKVAIDHAWGNGEAGENSKLIVEKDGRYNVTFTYDPVAPTTSAVAELVEEIVIDPTAKIMGTLAQNGWDGDDLTLSSDKKSASITLTLVAGSYEFKMFINGSYRGMDGEGSTPYVFHRDWTKQGGITGNSVNNMVLNADVDGDYEVTWFFDNDSIAFTFPAPADPDYFLKNNWGTAEWTWKQATRDSEGLYRLENVVYGGTGVNFNTVAADNDDSKFVAHENLKYTDGSAIAPYDTLNFVLDPANDTIWAEVVNKDVATYAVAGSSLALFYNQWEPCHPYGYTNMKKLDDGSYEYKVEGVTLPAGNIEYKVVKNCDFENGNWPSENAILSISESGIYDVTFTFNPATGAVSAEATFKGAVSIQTLDLKGSWDEWAGSARLLMDEYNEKALVSISLAAGEYEFKLLNEFSQWLGDGQEFSRDNASIRNILVGDGANMKLEADAAGEYLFTFIFKTNKMVITFPSVVPDEKIAALDGEFSINNSNGKAKFSRGNLQYNYGANAWYAAGQQYEVLGDLNLRLGDDTYQGSVDLFSWSCESSNYGLLPSNKDADFTGDFVEWGDMFVGGAETWSTLSSTEWSYLMNRTKDSHKLWTMASIGPDSITGLMLFPDKWTAPDGFALDYEFYDLDDEEALKAHWVSFSEWFEWETAGAVFLPLAGSRAGAIGSMWNGTVESTSKNPLNGWYCWVSNVNEMGYYWFNNAENDKNAYYTMIPGKNGALTAYTAPIVTTREKRRGNSVRLVYKYTVDPTAIDNAELGEQAVKMLKDNQVVIIKGDKTFNIVGQRIR